ncbi:MAG: DUF885 domain-containing protein [Armatimonadota bacterium]|nr:DUF885 domain-containing protein [Armatimonadota bacterium]MDR5696474.1 DUF885 domain-containing protein [Armatimonadota bacterium]
MKSPFEQLADRTLSAHFAFYPMWASRIGLHDYDGQAGTFGPDAIDRRIRELSTFRRQLEAVDPSPLPPQHAMDRELLMIGIEREQFELEGLREFARNPIVYTHLLDVSHYIKRDYAPLDERLNRLAEHLNQFPRVVADARRNLERCPRPHAQTAVEMFEGLVEFLETDLPQAANPASDRMRTRLSEACGRAATAVGTLLRHLHDVVLPQTTDEFAIGPQRFQQMLWTGERVAMDVDELARVGEAELDRLKARCAEVARAIDGQRSPAEIVRAMAEEHPDEAELIPATRRILDELRAFLVERDLVGLPEQSDCRVEPTPPFLRWAFAMMDTSGPFEERATESYYYVTLPDPKWAPEQKEQWLRRFDYYTLTNTSVHEAYPGHYIHFLHLKRVPSRVAKVYTSYAFVEGWAHYCEEMMLEAGYGEGNPKFQLAQVLDALTRAVRYVVAVGMHARGMTVQQAARRFVEDAYLEPLPASKEAERGTFDPGYLNYTLGKLMVRRLRADCEREWAGAFRLREFHDRLIGLGAPPLPLARRALLQDPGGPLL